MKKIINIIFVIAVSLPLMFTSCLVSFAKDIKGDGKLITQSIPISSFSKIEIETMVDVNFSQEKNKGNLEFTVDNNLWDYYDIYTKADVLHIQLKKEHKNKINLKPTKSMITVSSEQLENIEIAGSSTFSFCTAFNSERLSFDLAGSSTINANKFPVNIDSFNIEMAGAVEVYLSGQIGKGVIEIAGSGSVKALGCKFGKLSVEIAGNGEVEAYVLDKLDVEIAGIGSVNYQGNPKVSTDIAGSGKVKKL
jgi:hypothetical protein